MTSLPNDLSRPTVREIGIFDHMDRGESGASAFYAQRLALTELYDRSGFYSYHLAEHHSTPLGLAPSPNVFLSMVAGRTRRLRIGALVYLLPLYHPLRLLEELCMLDQMSGGRLDVGVGRGISPIEAGFYGAHPEQSQAIFEEALAVLLAGFATRELTYDGAYFHFKDVPVETAPFQRPHPPLWYGVSSPESAARCARDGYNVLTLSPPDKAADIVGSHRAVARETAPDLLAGIGRFVVVAETDDAARAIADSAYPRWYRNFNSLYRKYGRGPVQGERPSRFAGVVEAGTGIAGSPETVWKALDAQLRRTDSNYFVGQFAFGDMPHADAVHSIELFARDVMPELARSRAGGSNAMNRTVIVTGAGRGIGRAYALRFGRDGYNVTIADLNLPGAENVRDEIVAAGGAAIAVRTDVADEASCHACVAQTLDAFGRIDVLINNAALFADIVRRPFWDLEAAEWDSVLGVNARGTWQMMKAAAPAMREQRSGSIVNISSNTFLSGVSGFAHYIASKGAVIGLTRSAARDLGEYNVRVNCILPGLTRTEVVRTSDEPGRYDQLLKSQSLKRVETPDDLVGTAAFLASDDSAFMTGQALTVDGGNSFH